MEYIKKRIPAYIKIILSLIISFLKIKYSFLKKISLIEYGNMEEINYSRRIFYKFWNLCNKYSDKECNCILELGPGDSISTGIYAYYNKIQKTYLVDQNSYANKNLERYKNLIRSLKNENLINNLKTFDDILKSHHIEYLTNGLKSIKKIPSNTIDFIFSCAVLEHIKREEFLNLNRELFRILKKDGLIIHEVDYKDHLRGYLDSYKIPTFFWESKVWKSNLLYTNRIHYQLMRKLFLIIGFKIIKIKKKMWKNLPTEKKKMIDYFLNKSDKSLKTSVALFILAK